MTSLFLKYFLFTFLRICSNSFINKCVVGNAIYSKDEKYINPNGDNNCDICFCTSEGVSNCIVFNCSTLICTNPAAIEYPCCSKLKCRGIKH